jgi:hypothetical protein
MDTQSVPSPNVRLSGNLVGEPGKVVEEEVCLAGSLPFQPMSMYAIGTRLGDEQRILIGIERKPVCEVEVVDDQRERSIRGEREYPAGWLAFQEVGDIVVDRPSC